MNCGWPLLVGLVDVEDLPLRFLWRTAESPLMFFSANFVGTSSYFVEPMGL